MNAAATAFHEAAHVVMLLFYQICFHCVEICGPGHPSGCLGHVTFTDEGRSRPIGAGTRALKERAADHSPAVLGQMVERNRRMLVVVAAGDVGLDLARRDRAVRDEGRTGGDRSNSDADQLGIYASMIHGAEVHGPLPDELLDGEIFVARALSRALLPQLWPAVEALAAALLHKSCLMHEECRQVFDEALAGTEPANSGLADTFAREGAAVDEDVFQRDGCDGWGPCDPLSEIRAVPNPLYAVQAMPVLCHDCFLAHCRQIERTNLSRSPAAPKAIPRWEDCAVVVEARPVLQEGES